MRRRRFLEMPVAAAAAAVTVDGQRIIATGDGIPHTPEEYAKLLERLASGIESDSYSQGGIVSRLEAKMAAILGKEAAVWLPTGTLANHLAVRMLAGARRRVLVQHECHLYNDSGDCAQTLSGIHLVGLAPGRATFTVEEVEREADRAGSGRVAVPIGAIQIESPVRRKQGEVFDWDQMRAISTWARGRGIGLHLDGARLFLEAAYRKRPVRDYAALFDTVYVSMYKYFNAASGAILAGPGRLLEGFHHTRRMFGGGLNQVWPFAAVALHYAEGFEGRFSRAVDVSERVMAALEKDGLAEIQRVPNGTNIFRLRARRGTPEDWRRKLAEAGVVARAAEGGAWLQLQVNETWNRCGVDEAAGRFRKGLT